MKKAPLSHRLIRFLLIAVLTAGVIIAIGLGLESHVTSLTSAPAKNSATQAQIPGKQASPTPFPATIALSPLPSPSVTVPSPTAPSPTAPSPTVSAASPQPAAVATNSVPATPPQPATRPQPVPPTENFSSTQQMSEKTSYGHFPYQENDRSRLQVVGQYVRDGSARDEVLDVEAVQAFRQMQKAAASVNVSLMPLSGFRDLAIQAVLFENQTARQGSKEAAARWSAPPGYSEHHTGYAIDIADEQAPDSDLRMSFADTAAYQWLLANANQFGFELSFPPNNLQGISYEPWHWRFVGSARAMQVFAYAKSFE